MTVLDIRNVSKNFGTKQAVKALNFSVSPGEIFGFLGGNGAGKTTSLRMFLDIIRPDTGSIALFGEPAQKEHHANIGFLPEERGLYRNMTALETLIYFGRLKNLSQREARTRAQDILNRFGLTAESNKKVSDFSKGMAQKVQIGTALIHQPKLLILDEPFSGLDPINQTLLEHEITNAAQNGAAVLFSTHIMQHAERLSDRILILARGETRFHGTVPEALHQISNTITLTTCTDPSSLPGIIQATPLTQEDDGWSQWAVTLAPGQSADNVLLHCTQNAIPLKGFEQPKPSLHDAFIHIAGDAASPSAQAA